MQATPDDGHKRPPAKNLDDQNPGFDDVVRRIEEA
jgi:hypothetical protein